MQIIIVLVKLRGAKAKNAQQMKEIKEMAENVMILNVIEKEAEG